MIRTINVQDGTDLGTFNIVPGTPSHGEGDEIRGGGVIPFARVSNARNGSCEVIINDTDTTLTAMVALRSTAGEGKAVVTLSDADGVVYTSYHALVDVSITGNDVQKAKITWKGTVA